MLSETLWKIKSYLANILGLPQLIRNPNITISKSASVKSNASITSGPLGAIEVGDDTFINEFCSIYTFDSFIKIGKGVLVGPATVMHTHQHNFEKTDNTIKQQGGNDEPIIIEDDVWIGAHCTILGGVRIGAHSVIGAHSLVNRSIPANSVAYGVPCKVKRSRS